MVNNKFGFRSRAGNLQGRCWTWFTWLHSSNHTSYLRYLWWLSFFWLVREPSFFFRSMSSVIHSFIFVRKLLENDLAKLWFKRQVQLSFFLYKTRQWKLFQKSFLKSIWFFFFLLNSRWLLSTFIRASVKVRWCSRLQACALLMTSLILN